MTVGQAPRSLLVIAEAMHVPEDVPGPCGLVIQDRTIRSLVRSIDARHVPAGMHVVDCRPWRLAPGYVDLHTHGYAGSDVTTGCEADVRAMAAALPRSGVTSFLPTIASTGPAETLLQVERIAKMLRPDDPTRAEVLGIRLEGPFISRAKKGAQNEAAIRPPDAAEVTVLSEHGPVRIVDYAPEEDRELRFVSALIDRHIVPSVGHTMATYEQTIAALDAGARHCTHLFNAMPPLEHRAPGAAGALLTDDRATVEIIADGIHLHPAMLRLVLAERGPRSTALVTDAMAAAGLADGRYSFLGSDVTVAGGAVRMPDGTLAGSILTLDQAVRNLVVIAGASWSDAIRMATLTPATIVGVARRKGVLRPGADADFVVLDDAGRVRQTWCAGRLVFDAAAESSQSVGFGTT